jgi:hypothetical protein
MGNIKENEGNVDGVPLIGKTIRDNDNDSDSTALIIPEEFAIALGIESSKVSMPILDDFSGNRYLIVSKYHHEIVID